MMPPLTWALHLRRLGHHASAAEALLEAWRAEPFEVLGQVLIDLSAGDPQWTQLEQDARRIERLREVEPFMRTVRARGRDPRKTAVLLRIARIDLSAAPVTLNQLADAFETNGDPRSRAPLWLLGDQKPGREGEVWRRLAERIPEAPTPPPDAAGLLARLTGPVELHPALAAIYAEPDRDELLAVLADQLIEAGDPWGELINYERAELNDPRADVLLSELAFRLRESLAPTAATVVRTRRGFPDKVSIDLGVPLSGTPTAAWRTVREITFQHSQGVHRGEQAFDSPCLDRIEVVKNLPAHLLGILRLPSLTRVGVSHEHATTAPAWTDDARASKLLADLPALQRLEIDRPHLGLGALADWQRSKLSARLTLAFNARTFSVEWPPTGPVKLEIKLAPVQAAVEAIDAIIAQDRTRELEVRLRRQLLAGNEAPLQGALARSLTPGRILAT